MSKFKVGDKVILKSGRYDLEAGDIFEITKIDDDDDIWVMGSKLFPGGTCHDVKEFILLDSSETPEELFKKFLVGIEAKDKLIEMGMLEAALPQKDFFTLKYKNDALYRLKKKEFKPFTVGDWKVLVSSDGEILHIGCRDFKLKAFKIILDALVTGSHSADINGQRFMATRKGILHDKHTLTWEDADLILNKLNEWENA